MSITQQLLGPGCDSSASASLKLAEGRPPAGTVLWVDLTNEDLPQFDATAQALELREEELSFLTGSHVAMSTPAKDSITTVAHCVTINGEGQLTFDELRLLTTQGLLISVRVRDKSPEHPLDIAEALPISDRELSSVDALAGLLSALLSNYPLAADTLESAIEEMEDLLVLQTDLDSLLAHRLYQLLQTAHRFEWALRPLESLASEIVGTPGGPASLVPALPLWPDLARRIKRLRYRAELLRSHLQNTVTLYSTMLTLEQNDATRRIADASYAQGEQSKKISAWAAIIFAPTVIASMYGMNFRHMPELEWIAGYPLAVALMLIVSLTLWLIFRARRWL
ncbi:CorA family divalent cation transporter [Nesterenkonia natronophila]|nr:CorA family divalent cation transporter [Nesterenkonia natronophila]